MVTTAGTTDALLLLRAGVERLAEVHDVQPVPPRPGPPAGPGSPVQRQLELDQSDNFLAMASPYASFWILTELHLHGRLTAEDGHHDLDRAPVEIYFLDDTG